MNNLYPTQLINKTLLSTAMQPDSTFELFKDALINRLVPPSVQKFIEYYFTIYLSKVLYVALAFGIINVIRRLSFDEKNIKKTACNLLVAFIKGAILGLFWPLTPFFTETFWYCFAIILIPFT